MIEKIFVTLFIFVLCLSACTPAETEEPTQTPAAEPSPTPPPPGETAEPGGIPGTSKEEEEGLAPNPLEPLPNEENMVRGNVFIDNIELVVLESFPVQAVLQVQGTLPTPCHHLRGIVNWSEGESRIEMELFSLADPQSICTQALEPFETDINLGAFEEGEYTVWVNGEQVGEFTAP